MTPQVEVEPDEEPDPDPELELAPDEELEAAPDEPEDDPALPPDELELAPDDEPGLTPDEFEPAPDDEPGFTPDEFEPTPDDEPARAPDEPEVVPDEEPGLAPEEPELAPERPELEPEFDAPPEPPSAEPRGWPDASSAPKPLPSFALEHAKKASAAPATPASTIVRIRSVRPSATHQKRTELELAHRPRRWSFRPERGSALWWLVRPLQWVSFITNIYV